MEVKEESMQRKLDTTTSSMDVLALNNVVVSMRPLFKKAKVHIIRKMTRQIGKYKNRKGTPEIKQTFQRKAQKLIDEISIIKALKPDKVSKFALGNEKSFGKLAQEESKESRAVSRLATHSAYEQYISKWRKEHDDWRSLAAFIQSKNTGRRFKNKKIKEKIKTLEPTNTAKKLESIGDTDNNVKKAVGKYAENEAKKLKTDPVDSNSSSSPSSSSEEEEEEDEEVGTERKVEEETSPVEMEDNSEDDKSASDESIVSSDDDDESVKEESETISPATSNTKHKTLYSNKQKNKRKITVDSDIIMESDKHKSLSTSNIKQTSNSEVEKRKANINKETVIKKIKLDSLLDYEDIDLTSNLAEKDVSMLFGNKPVSKSKRDSDPFFITSDDDKDGEKSNINLPQKVEKEEANSNLKTDYLFASSLAHSEEKKFDRKDKKRLNNERNIKGSKGNNLETNSISKNKDSIVKNVEEIHPSWQASKKRKEMAIIQTFKGKKTVFEDDDD